MTQELQLSREELLAKYQRLRHAGRELNNKLMKLVTRHALDWAGTQLGIRQGGTFVFDDECEMDVVMDCCIFDYRRNGKSVVQQYLAKSGSRLSADEATILKAMHSPRFSIFAVADTTPGLGVTLHDTLRNDRVFVVDVGLGSTAKKGEIMAGRLISPDGLTMTTGAIQPVGAGAIDEIGDQIDDLFANRSTDLSELSSKQLARFATTVIRACLNNESTTRVRYADVETIIGRSPAAIRRALSLDSQDSSNVDFFAGGEPKKPGLIRSLLGPLLPRRYQD